MKFKHITKFFYKPSSPASPATEIKKPRHGDMIRKTLDEPATPTKTSGAVQPATVMSPPNHAESQRTPTSSPGGQETQATQVASQFAYADGEGEEVDPTVWGYLDPIQNVSTKVIKLNKSPDCNHQTGTRSKPGSSKKKPNPSGFLIGRHQECDLRIDDNVISNRHCLIYKVNGILYADLYCTDYPSFLGAYRWSH
jgi:serine/threonine-protein kinase Chk2